MPDSHPIIEIQNLKNYIGNEWVHKDLSLSVYPREILAIVGSSGSGKTTLLDCIVMLRKPTAGKIKVFDVDIAHANREQLLKIHHRWGVLFQHGALFSSLTVLENVMFPLRQFTRLPLNLQQEIALLKIVLVGLPIETAHKYPGELSGGMIKRAALARALALDPELLFLDEPTSGLDPKSSDEFDNLILKLRQGLGLTVVIVTHDMDLLSRISDRVAFLGKGKLLAVSNIKELMNNPEPLIREYFTSVKKIKIS